MDYPGYLTPSFVTRLDRFIEGGDDREALLAELGRSSVCDEVSFQEFGGAPYPVSRYASPILAKMILKPVALWKRVKEDLHKFTMRALVMASVTPEFVRRELDDYRLRCGEQLLDKKQIALRVTLQDASGVKYDGMLCGRAVNMVAGRFVFRVGGIAEPYETTFAGEALTHDEVRFATVQINLPGVGRSEGKPTAETLGRAARVGLFFTEALSQHYKERRGGARGKIMLKGFSLGAGALSRAIVHHSFPLEDNDYQVMSINTFGRLSDVPGHYISQFVGHPLLKRGFRTVGFMSKHFLRQIGADLDGIAAAKKLSSLKIPQIIIQACHKADEKIVALDDGIISGDISLLTQLQKRGLHKDKIIVQNCRITPKLIKSQGTVRTKFIHCDIDKPMIRYFLETFATN